MWAILVDKSNDARKSKRTAVSTAPGMGDVEDCLQIIRLDVQTSSSSLNTFDNDLLLSHGTRHDFHRQQLGMPTGSSVCQLATRAASLGRTSACWCATGPVQLGSALRPLSTNVLGASPTAVQTAIAS